MVTLLLAAACGGGSPKASGTIPATTSPTSSTTPGAGSPSGTTSPKTPPSTVSPKPTQGKPTARGTSTGGSVARLDRTCVRRGVDLQGLTLTTSPGSSVAYSTKYSDGSDVVSNPNGGGYGYGTADSAGHWRTTWTVPATAPTGLATVTVTTVKGYIYVSFKIVAKNGRCT